MDKRTILPYYPYGLKCIHTRKPNDPFRIVSLHNEHLVLQDLWERTFKISYTDEAYRMVLRPLSALTTSIKVNKTQVTTADLIYQTICKTCDLYLKDWDREWIVQKITDYFSNRGLSPFSRNTMNEIYYILQVLHFDLSGLILRKEAISALELPFDPYEFDEDIPV